MKSKIYVVCFLTLMMTGFAASAQVYKTAADTVKLNKEFTEVSNDIATLTAQLTVAQNNMPGYQSKAKAAESNAQDAAETSSTQAAKATEGNSVKEARKAKHKSKKAYHKAKDAQSANNNVGDQDDKIASLTGQLAKKQERLRQLTDMRASINAVPQNQ
jgi:DNA repair exonuclease SbcCD ATPase subunit